jgi:F-type H+-transporting ATPase subunit epsilon
MIQFELVSPEKKLMSEEVTMAVIPGTEGDFGVLSGHMPLITNVRTGVVEIYRENMTQVSERVFIAGGFADVSGEQCTLLAEQAINVNDIDVDDVTRQISEAEEKLNSVANDIDKKNFHKKIDILRAMAQSAA